ncbi:MAG: hypothetical protein AAGH76_03025 [Pseudomonadota bacterium]
MKFLAYLILPMVLSACTIFDRDVYAIRFEVTAIDRDQVFQLADELGYRYYNY